MLFFKFIAFLALLIFTLANNCKKDLIFDVKSGKCLDAHYICQPRTYTSPRGQISKGQEYFDNFANVDCQYQIQVAPNKQIQLHIDDFFSESSGNSITIYNGNSVSSGVMAVFTESTKQTFRYQDFISSSNVVTIVSRTLTSESIFTWHLSYSTLSSYTSLSLSNTIQVIQSPGFPNNYNSLENQIFVITHTSPWVITLTFDILDIPEDEYTLFIYDGLTRFSTKLLSVTGQKTSSPLTITSTGNSVSVYFVPVKSNIKNARWQISLTSQIMENVIVPTFSCPSTYYTASSGVLSSSNYPNGYTNNLDCYYQITLPFGQTISLSIDDFVTEACCDILYIYDGTSINSRLIAMHKGDYTNNVPINIISTSNNLLLYFHSDVSNVAKGWHATYASYTTSTVPSVQYISTSTGSLSNSNLPSNYPSNTDYSFIIRVPMYFKINLQVTNFQCLSTTMTIFDGPVKQSVIIDTLTGNKVDANSNPLQYSSTYNYISMVFNQVTGILNCGFNLTWSTQKIHGFCGVTSFTKPSGIITSPGFDGNYPNNLNCMVKINLPPHKRILITMDFFITEQDSDYLTIYDGNDDSSPVIGIYSGDLTTQLSSLSFTSYTNTLTLVFYSDFAINDQGWKLHYETIDETKSVLYYATSGQIQSNNFPQNYAVYDTEMYLIQNSYGYPITFTVDSFSLASKSSLVFYNGNTFSGNIIANLTGSSSSPTTFTSTSSSVLVYFVAKTTDVGSGFSLSWTSQDNDPTCPRKVYQNSFGAMSSPNYPNNYANNQDCYYYIIVKPGKRIEFDLVSFNTEVNYDKLYIYDGPDTSSTPFITDQGIISQSDTASQVKSSSNTITLWFHSDGSNTAPGFTGFYNEIDVSNIVTVAGSTGSLTSVNYPQNYNRYADEHYLIRVLEKQSITITLIDISLQASYTTLSIYDGPSESYPLLGSYTSYVTINSNNATLYATQNMVTITFKTEFPITDKGFSLSWTSQ